MFSVDLHQCHHGEETENRDLGAEQELLDTCRELDAAIANPGHQRDPQDRGSDDGTFRVGGRFPAKELVAVHRRYLSERGHHDHVGQEDRPAVDPAGCWTQSACRPRERGARVRVGAVQIFVGSCDQQHRHERDEQHRGRVHANPAHGDDHPERRRQRVGRRRRGHADHDVRQVADRVFLQPLVHHARLFRRSWCGCADGGHPLLLSRWCDRSYVVHQLQARGAIPKTYS